MRVILVSALVLVFLGCTKGKFTTKPQLKFKSVNLTTVSGNQELRISLDLTDKEGDYTSFLGVKKTVKSCPLSEFTDSSKFAIPGDFLASSEKEGEVVVSMKGSDRGSNGCNAPGGGLRPDTAVYLFWTKDKAGNVSDTARTPTIIILN
jgi:hypothetical protein